MSIYIASFVGFGLIFLGEAFIQKWVGAGYLDAYPVLLILVTGLLFAFFHVPGLDFLLGTTGYRFVGIINLIEGLCNLMLSLVLVRFYGLVGVALGTLIPITIIKIFIQPIYVSRMLSVQVSEYIERVARPILLVFLSLILPAVISRLLAIPDYRVLFMLGVVSLILYSLSLRVFGFSASEIAMIRDTISLHGPKIQVSR
jgi:O-antigen/teichoic acid export membrane protein